MGFSSTEIDNLFPTPFITANFADEFAADLNDRLKKAILVRQSETLDTASQELGSWRSDDNLIEWGGDPVNSILSSLKELINGLTTRSEAAGVPHPIAWQEKAWAEVHSNRSLALPQTNPGSFWTAIYYVHVEDDELSPQARLEFPDPRGPMPRLYCPWLRFGIKNYVSAGMAELMAPKAGLCFLFPSFLTYAFKPRNANQKDVVLTFTFSASV